MTSKIRIAVIGAGISGLTVARHLSDAFNITVFEKSNRSGGRVTSKLINGADFDYGAQFFTVKTPEFQHLVSEMQSQGVIACWHGHFVEFDGTTRCSERDWDDSFPHYVGTPNMAAISEWMAKPLDVRYHTNVSKLNKSTHGWKLVRNNQELGEFERVILTMPPKQALDLLPAEHQFHQPLRQLKMQSCFALRVVLKHDIDLGFSAALIRNNDISWISKNSSKPNRTGSPSIIVQATNNWSDEHLDDALEDVKRHMLECLLSITPLSIDDIAHSDIKKWVHANTPKQADEEYLLDTDTQLAVCGDALIHGRIESAFTSAHKLAQRLLHEIKLT